MELLRTPDERFENLEGYPFSPNYVEVPSGEGESLRVHYLDEGPKDGPLVLALHGEPSWSYLYRTMIPPLVEAGYRVIAPDLPGFGRSDKPASKQDYTYQRFVDWMTVALIEELDLSGITLVCQDWGGLIGLRLVAENPERFDRYVVANTMLPTGDREPGEAFLAWQKFSQETEDFVVSIVLAMGTATDLSDEVMVAYDAPFPDDSYKAGARIFPSLVPTSPDDPAAEPNRMAWKVLELLDLPVLTAFSDGDPITGGGDLVFQQRIPGTKGQPHTVIEGGGHFLQEDRGSELAAAVIAFMKANGA